MTDEAAFLGKGWAFPPTFTRGGANLEMVSADEDIHQSLRIIISTQPGERVMQDQFGCGMDSFVFAEFDHGMINTIRQTISDAILYHEPRVELENLSITEDKDEPELLLISIEYTVRGTNSRYKHGVSLLPQRGQRVSCLSGVSALST